MTYRIKTITESLRDDVLCGAMTIQGAARELHRSGWLTHIDVPAAKKLLAV